MDTLKSMVRLGEVEAKLAVIAARRDRIVQRAHAAYANVAEPLLSEQAQLRGEFESLSNEDPRKEAWSDTNPAGEWGFRAVGQPAIKPREGLKDADAIERIRTGFRRWRMVIKESYELKRTALRDYDDATLRRWGLVRGPARTFFVSPRPAPESKR